MRKPPLPALLATIQTASWLFLLVLCLAGVPRRAAAQWTAADAQTAFSSYNQAFYFSPDGTHDDYRSQQGASNTSGFWVGAEEIELAIDAYNQNPTPENTNIINQLCAGFVAQFGNDWSANTYDDDLMWATIAFVRAYQATGTTAWLTNAETNFAVVWSRGYDTTFGGGIWWNAAVKGESGFKNSPANWTFVIAGNLLYQASGDATYLNEANTIFSWASSTLYDPATGKIYDGINSSGIQAGQYSYNYGVAVGADYFEKRWSDADRVATYLIDNLSSGTVGGYNIMPNYGQGGTDGGGFNGIALRWIAYAYVHGAITNANVLGWAQTNVGLAWALRNAVGLSWNNWTAATADSGLYSWDCSNTVVGMEDVPPQSGASDYALSASPASLLFQTGASGSSTIQVSPASGFGSTVQLTATVIGSPAGLTASLDANSISGAGSSTLTVSATSATLGGNYVVAVTGTSGNIAHTIFVQVGLPYFALSVAPGHLFLNQDGKATSTVTILPRNGFNSGVQFTSPSGLPEGVTASFTPAMANGSSTLTLNASATAQTTVGTPLSITGTSGGVTASASAGTLSVSAAPEDCGTGVPLDLSSAYNVTGIYPDGATYAKSGGLDGVGFSYSSNLLSTARSLSHTLFQFGRAGKADAIAAQGQTIPLPKGAYTALHLLALGVNGNQAGQKILVTYTDGTTSSFTQSFSDWYSSSGNANETEAVAMGYRNYAGGTHDQAQINLYDYTFLLQSGKAVSSVTLPNNPNVRVLAATMTRQDFGSQASLSSALNVDGIYSDGATFSPTGGLDGRGASYSANLLGDIGSSANLIVHDVDFAIYPSGADNALYGTGQTIALPPGHFNTLQMLGTGVDGNQTAQPVTVTYTDGTNTRFSQGFSDWFAPQGYPGEYDAVKMTYRDQSDGSESSQPFHLYRYVWPLDPGKVARSVTLSDNRNVIALSFAMAREYPVVACR